MYKVYCLVNLIKICCGVNSVIGVVEGIFVVVVLYMFIMIVMVFFFKGGGFRWFCWFWVFFDILFVGVFIVVVVIIFLNGGMVGLRYCYDDRDVVDVVNVIGEMMIGDDSCDLFWGMFILVIVSM